jgi:hypothetical protein
MTGYFIEAVHRDEVDDLVVTRLRSSHGSGVTVFRVVEDAITDIWSINAAGRDATQPF